MIIISNHARTIGMEIPNHYIVRINVAWVKTIKELNELIIANKDNIIFLDYPTGRTKPPAPTLTLAETISVINKYPNIVYFAFSNAEDINIIELIRQAVPKHVKLVPKIETISGIQNLEVIAKAANTDLVMIDKEDLYTAFKGNFIAYETAIKEINKRCKKAKIESLNLKAVVFSND